MTDREKIFEVSREKGGEDYTAESLKELFSKFGEVEDILIASSRKKCSALIQMATKEATVAATRNVYSHLSISLLVLPVKQAAATVSIHPARESDRLDNLGGSDYTAYENSVLEKIQKVPDIYHWSASSKSKVEDRHCSKRHAIL
ncbi:DNAJ heat shock N-terminal domain-containing protein [Euphorbia peplus]|nr:DNAJ heat shock N-terminal domain-containing protein [Euphorbia peplus]